MIDFSKYKTDYEIPLNPANIVDFVDLIQDDNVNRSSNYYVQSDAYLECADELVKWLCDNVKSANIFDYSIVLYLMNHAVELKLKAILIKIGKNITTHNFVKLAKEIPDEYFYELIDDIDKQTFIDIIEKLNKYNTDQNELGRYIDTRGGERLARNDNGEVHVRLISIVYIYHQIIDLLNEKYKRIIIKGDDE